ncbi:hypothetical protein [Arsukibacterium indicum]|nr:hypothetical protein [Arsukibacterium indicum]
MKAANLKILTLAVLQSTVNVFMADAPEWLNQQTSQFLAQTGQE